MTELVVKKDKDCATGCGNKSDGTIFNAKYPVCQTCHDVFVAWVGFGKDNILYRMKWLDAVKKFIGKMRVINGN